MINILVSRFHGLLHQFQSFMKWLRMMSKYTNSRVVQKQWMSFFIFCSTAFLFQKSKSNLCALNQNNIIIWWYYIYSVSTSTELQDLLRKILTKDPEKRITLSEVRTHPWVLQTTRSVPSKEENCQEEIDISEDDIQSAIKPFYTPIHILVCIVSH